MGCVSHIGVNTPSSFAGVHVFISSKLLLTAVCFPNWQVVQLLRRMKERASEDVESWFETWDRAVPLEVQNWGIQNGWKVVYARLRTEPKQEAKQEMERERT